MPDVRPAIIELTSARTKEFLREPEALFWVFAFPMLLALVLGFAFREKPPDRVPIAIVAGPHAAARLTALQKSPALLVRVMPEGEARLALRRGRVSLLVEEGDAIVYRYDPTRPDARTARVETDDTLETAAGRHNVIAAHDEHVHERGSRYIDFLVPGLLGMNLMGTGMWSMGFSVVNARTKKLLKRLIATPMRRSQYLLAQFLSRLVFLVFEVVFLVAFGWIVFGVRVTGSLVLLGALCLLGATTFSSLGLLTASRARTLEAASGMMNFIMMPMWLCSGVFFSYERFPDAVKPLIRALPLTALNDALRAVINDGAGIAAILSQTGVLALYAVLCFAVGLKIFRWQ